MAAEVGFLHGLRLEWMNKAMELSLEEKDINHLQQALNGYLAGMMKSEITRRKARSMLMDIWIRPQSTKPNLGDLRKHIHFAVQSATSTELCAMQYALLLASYPIFLDACSFIGKVTSIQDSFTTEWLNSRLYEKWGERQMINRAAQYILQTLKDFDIIRSTGIGKHEIKVRPCDNSEVIRVLVMAVLGTKHSYVDLSDITKSPELFPFSFMLSVEVLQSSPEFSLHMFGGKMTVALQGT